ncbi:GNAT family N-acetyltransferase [Massilia aurea]|uniref:GNAT family N-acetyltransferase n=1 Tax=Massilia aurea TaxID=373040 RepID=UPI003461FD13
MSERRFGALTGRAPGAQDATFLAALYLATRPDLGALPVPRSVIEGIARHQQQLQTEDYARRYPAAETWLLVDGARGIGKVVLDWTSDTLRVVDLAVAHEARRRGVARTVLLALQHDCHGQRTIALRVRAENAAARALYAACGFAVKQGDGTTLELRWG